MLYEELLAFCQKRLLYFFRNVPTFENQFCWTSLSKRCYEEMYQKHVITGTEELKRSIPGLAQTCQRCAAFYIPARNKSIPKYDLILGKQLEEALMAFLSAKLGAKTCRGDQQNLSLPDCRILKPDGKTAAYFEVKFHAAPFVKSRQFTGRYCYEGSATLDLAKIQKQLALIDSGLDAPVFYVHWIEYPCLKGIFYQTSAQVRAEFAGGSEFARRFRDGDRDKAPKNVYLSKKYAPLLEMGDFESFAAELERLIHT